MQTMKMMGMRGWVLDASWLLTALCSFSVIAVELTWLMAHSFLPRSSASLLLAYLLLFFCSEIAFAFLLSAFFSRAKLAAVLGPVSLFAAVLPRYVFFGTSNVRRLAARPALHLCQPVD